MNEPTTISIIEADALTRQILSHWISQAPGFRCAGAHADARDALRRLPEEAPDLVLADIQLPDAIECIRQLKALLPGTRFIMLSIFEDADQVYAALAAGAAGCLPKNLARTDLIAALGEARQGALEPSSDVARKVLLSFRAARVKLSPVMELGATEWMVLEFLARGYRRGEIAAALGVSLPTVNAHLGGISAKFQARCRLNDGGDPRRPAASAPAARPAGPAGGNSVRTAPGFLSINELAGSRTVTIAG